VSSSAGPSSRGDSAAFGSLPDAERHETHEELTVLDRVGRLQIPREYLDALGLAGQNKIKVVLEGKRIVLTRPREEHPSGGGTPADSGSAAGGGQAPKNTPADNT